MRPGLAGIVGMKKKNVKKKKSSCIDTSKMNKREIVLIIELAVRTGQAGTTR